MCESSGMIQASTTQLSRMLMWPKQAKAIADEAGDLARHLPTTSSANYLRA